jgi:hypothetical protein
MGQKWKRKQFARSIWQEAAGVLLSPPLSAALENRGNIGTSDTMMLSKPSRKRPQVSPPRNLRPLCRSGSIQYPLELQP